jgi:hypothetical protein
LAIKKPFDLHAEISMIGENGKGEGNRRFQMKKWEYMVRKTDFKNLSQPSFLELERVRLTEHGEEGWELVSVVPSQGADSLILFLKRAIAEPAPVTPEKKKK